MTVFPEESRTVTTGWVVKSVLFTNPAADLVIASCVASPERKFIVEDLVILLGELMDAVMTLSPIIPRSASPGKLTCPPLAAWVVVPIKDVSAVPLIDKLVVLPPVETTNKEPVVVEVAKA